MTLHELVLFSSSQCSGAVRNFAESIFTSPIQGR